MYAGDGTATARYYLESAWPSQVEISGLKAGASEVLYETVTLTVDDIQSIETDRPAACGPRGFTSSFGAFA